MRIVAVGTALLVLATTNLSAQKSEENRNPRQGFWIGFGLGGGSIGADCNSCDNTRTNGLSRYSDTPILRYSRLPAPRSQQLSQRTVNY